MKIETEITFTEPVLAGSPSNPEVYERFIASHMPAKGDAAKLEEVEALPEALRDETGFSVFPRTSEDVPHFWDYHIRGFLKEAALAVTGSKKDSNPGGLTAYKSKIDRWVFVAPRRLVFWRDGIQIPKPEGAKERIVRAMTAQGPRTTPKKSETMEPGAILRFELKILPLGQKEITPDLLRSWLDYGRFCGMGEWRSASHGRFEVTKFEVVNGAAK